MAEAATQQAEYMQKVQAAMHSKRNAAEETLHWLQKAKTAGEENVGKKTAAADATYLTDGNWTRVETAVKTAEPSPAARVFSAQTVYEEPVKKQEETAVTSQHANTGAEARKIIIMSTAGANDSVGNTLFLNELQSQAETAVQQAQDAVKTDTAPLEKAAIKPVKPVAKENDKLAFDAHTSSADTALDKIGEASERLEPAENDDEAAAALKRAEEATKLQKSSQAAAQIAKATAEAALKRAEDANKAVAAAIAMAVGTHATAKAEDEAVAETAAKQVDEVVRAAEAAALAKIAANEELNNI
eukprot:gnl/TRDRNA2_/TRDRNA2_151672_c0_seq2.p1 gnl/TRDRNA2_/TRDRNA2_151672_c0~~gnl/TRDRNA2_/TRDRNA2_151672_c0_seq2.p1  ORF type:complete len:301 (-),score=92.09 gnl/TRDRNA2_/TRDRNA2_151672_c0_seq2:51-953(-)